MIGGSGNMENDRIMFWIWLEKQNNVRRLVSIAEENKTNQSPKFHRQTNNIHHSLNALDFAINFQSETNNLYNQHPMRIEWEQSIDRLMLDGVSFALKKNIQVKIILLMRNIIDVIMVLDSDG